MPLTLSFKMCLQFHSHLRLIIKVTLFFLFLNLFFCIWNREIFFIDFHHYNVQLLLRGADGRNMWEESGLIGSGGLRSFSRRSNGNLGFVFLHSLVLLIRLGFISDSLPKWIHDYNAVKLARLRRRWSLDWGDLISSGLLYSVPC